MASFTDEILKFNPYVQQLPVELMMKVGMQKQAQYDAGVQKAQTYIDNIAGLDVAKKADKAYLQSKLGELGGKLKLFASADFSNQQLVNTVGGMTSDIIKDQNIQNAVASTSWYKKQEQELQKAYKDGKSSVANVQDFYDQANAYLNNDNVGEVFRGTYSPYIDLKKKWQDIIKTINPSASSEDYIYSNYIDDKGNVKTGDLAAAMTRVTKEGVERSTIENAIRASLSPDDINQMRIDANYRFRDIQTADQFKQALTSGYDAQIKSLDQEKEVLQGIVNSTGNDLEKQQAQLAIDKNDEYRQKLKNSLDGRLSLADQNLQAAKLDLYKDESIFQTANAFSWEKKATQLMTNPALQAQFERERIDISRAEYNERVKQNSWNRQQDLIRNEQWEKDYEAKIKSLYGEGSGFTTYLGKATENLADPTTAIQNKIDGYRMAEDSNLSVLANAMGTDKAKALLKLEEYKKDPNSLNPQLRRTADAILQSQYDQKILQNQLKTAKADVLASDPELRKRKDEIDNLLKNASGMGITTSDGTKYSYSKQELQEYLEAVDKLKFPAGTSSNVKANQVALINAAKSNLTPKQVVLFNKLLEGSPSANKILNPYREARAKDKEFLKDISTKVNHKLSTTNGDYVPAVTAIVTPTTESKAFYASVANTAAGKYSTEKLGIKGGSLLFSADDAKKVQEWTSGEGRNNLIFKKMYYGGDVHLSVTKDGEEIMIPLSPQEAAQLPKLGGEPNMFNEEISKIQIGNGSSLSTNPTGNLTDSYYQKWKLPNVKNTVMYADLNADHANPELNYININIKGKDGKVYPFTISTPMYADVADGFIRSMNDAKLKELYMTSSWKNDINNIF